MLRGISFMVSQTMNTKLLYKLFSCIEVQQYDWYNILSQCESWADSIGNEFLVRSYYSGKEFSNLISNPHYLVFTKLEAYHTAPIKTNISTYDEFVKSTCDLIVLINDADYVELYAKSQDQTKLLYCNAIQKGWKDVKYLTEITDKRKSMFVL